MTLTKRIILGFVLLYIIASAGTIIYTYYSVCNEVHADIIVQYGEYFRVMEDQINVFFANIQEDLETLAGNSVVTNRNDEEFTSFLEAQEDTFVYRYTEEELAIIELFLRYRTNHPYVNSVYMGRENGSFVRSHPRSSPTQYDPRERPWYQLAMAAPGVACLTQAYESVTNEDINIGTVIALQDNDGTVYGVLGMDVTLVSLSERMQKQVLSYDGWMELVDQDGIVLMSPMQEHLYTDSIYEDDVAVVMTKNGMILERGREYYQMSYPVSRMQGTLVAYLPVDSVMGRLQVTLLQRIAFITIVILVVALFTFGIVEIIVLKPVRKMKAAMIADRLHVAPRKMLVRASGEIEDFIKEYNGLIDRVEKEKTDLDNIKMLTVMSLVSLAEVRDNETGLHIIRTQRYVEILAFSYNRLYPFKAIPESKISVMVQCAPLHDIGKVAIPDHILLKPGRLTEEELAIMKMHTVYGRDTILKGYRGITDGNYMDTVVNLVYSHHERFDGKGYPEGMSGEQIPMEARIMALADVYDALTTKRVYKEAVDHNEAVKILRDGEGSQFDPDIFQAFLRVEHSFKAISEFYREE